MKRIHGWYFRELAALCGLVGWVWAWVAGSRCESCGRRSRRARMNGCLRLGRLALLCPDCDAAERDRMRTRLRKVDRGAGLSRGGSRRIRGGG